MQPIIATEAEQPEICATIMRERPAIRRERKRAFARH
ncbi:hypothetical protein X730_11935 [Mesorhizobium sp. L103C565B0]|nr:hypothetical protein X730_11935 [Mesorhizobium sp. L103C565B0]